MSEKKINENYFNTFVQSLENSYAVAERLNSSTNLNSLSPYFANELMKSTDPLPKKPTQAQLEKWLLNPRANENSLIALSNYLNNVVMQYTRIINHFATLLEFNNELIPTNTPSIDDNVSVIKKYKKEKTLANDFLKRLRLKSQFMDITKEVILEGAKFYYVRENENYVTFQELPTEYCTIDGKVDVGYTFSFDLSFFDSAGYQVLRTYAPEFAVWYSELIELRKINSRASTYVHITPQYGVCFKFDNTTAEIKPPLQGLFSDTLAIQDFKNLQKDGAVLDLWKSIFLEIPTDANGEPMMDAVTAGKFVSSIYKPNGVSISAVPMKPHAMNYEKSSDKNNYTGIAMQNFYDTSGTSQSIFNAKDSGVLSQKNSIVSDFNFVKHLYNYYIDYINFRLTLVTDKYDFRIKIFGNSFLQQDEMDMLMKTSAMGIGLKRLLAYYYEPYEIESVLRDERLTGFEALIIPLQSAFQQSGDSENGKPKDKESNLSDSGLATRDKGYNDNK